MFDKVLADVVALEFASIRQQSSSLRKRRAKILLSVPNTEIIFVNEKDTVIKRKGSSKAIREQAHQNLRKNSV